MTDIQLSEDDQAFIKDMIDHGIYSDADDVVHAGLRLLGSAEGRIAELRREIQVGIEDIEAGRFIEFEKPGDLMQHILKMVEERKNARTSTSHVPAGAGRSAGGL